MSLKPGSITFLIAALNEEENIEATVETILSAINDFDCDYEILLVNDGSTDRTSEIIDNLANNNPRINAIHNQKNLGLGGAYKKGIQYAQKEYIMWLSGDNAETADQIVNIASHIGKADIIIPVLQANKTRPWLRRVISRTFTLIVNTLFSLKIHYYNGTVIHRRELICATKITTNSFAYQAEALIRLLYQHHSYLEVPYYSARYDGMFSYAMRPKNLLAVLKSLVLLFIELRVKHHE